MRNKMIQDLMKYIASNMMHRLTRSSLTILSVLIGIMAIFALVSFGQGLSRYVDQISQESGADKLIAQPKGFGPPGSSGIFLTENDLNTIKKTIGVSEATGMIAKQAEVKRKENEKGKWVYAMSMPTVSSEQRLIDEAFGGIGLLKGRNLKKGDKGKAILGFNYQLPDKIFDVDDEYAFIYIRAAEGVSPAKLASRLEEKLRKEKGQKEGEEDFFVQTYEQLIETFGTILVVLNSILVIIAGISIVVAAVNIMNTMYTAVLERTKEIGVMKSIGARNSTILFMFFFESGVLGLIGGALGVVLGYVIAKTGGAIAAAAGYALLKPYFPWWLTVGCLLFSFLIGACSGYFPARQAASLKPVDALRYE